MSRALRALIVIAVVAMYLAITYEILLITLARS